MTEKHSPLKLPLTSVENSWQYTTIYEANGKELFRFDLEGWGVTERNQDRLEKRMAEVVGLIVRSVNGLPEAIAALEEIAGLDFGVCGKIASDTLTKLKG